MEQFYDLFIKGLKYLFSLAALPHIALFLAFFAILKLNDFRKGLILIFILASGILINLLLLGFKIFTLQNNFVLGLITIGTLIFSIWNFGFNPGKFRRKGGNMSSRYLVTFILGLLHGVYIYFQYASYFSLTQVNNIIGLWTGLFLSMIALLIFDFMFLWLLITFLRIKEENWLMVVSGAAMGIALSVYLIF